MNIRIAKLKEEYERNDAKIVALQAKNKKLAERIRQLENAEIVGAVRERGFTIAFAVLGAGGALYWSKIKNKKSSTKGSTDPNDLFEEDDEDYEIEDEETEIETYPETEDDSINNEESEDIDE